MIEAFSIDGVCAICRRNPVKRWCDYVVAYDNQIIFFRDYKDFVDANSAISYETCDLPLCDKCATNVGRDRDLCPHHMSLHSQVKLPEEYQRLRQIREKQKMRNNSSN